MPAKTAARRRRARSFIVQGSILAAASVLVRLIGLIYRIPMTRILGNEGMGYYGYAFEVYNLCFIISSYGMPMAVSKLVAGHTAKREYKSAFNTFLGAIIVAALTGGALSLIVYFGAGFICSKLLANAVIAIPLRVLAPTIFVSSILGVLRGFFQGKGTMVPTALSQLLEQIVNGIVSVAAAYSLEEAHSVSPDISAYGAAGGVAGTGLGAFFGLIFLIFLLVVNMPMFQRQMLHDDHEAYEMSDLVKMLLATVIPVMLSQVLVRSNGLIAMTMFNHITKMKHLSAEETTSLYGIYESKYLLLMNIVTGITTAITTAMIPSIVAVHETGDMDAVEGKANVALKFNLLIAIPCTFGFAFLGAPIVRLLFGDNSPVIKGTMFLGAAACTLYTLSILFNTIIQSIYKMMLPVRNSAIAIVIDVLVIFLMLRFTDQYLYALVIGNMILPIVVIILDLPILTRTLGIHFELRRSVILPILSSVVMTVVMMLVYFGVEKITNYAVAVLAAIFVAMIVYFVAEIKLHGITERELRNVPKGMTVIRIAKRFHLM